MAHAQAASPARNDPRPTAEEIALMREKARMVRLETIRLIQLPKIGHYTSVFSCAEIFSSLYYGVMSLKHGDPKWADRDRFTYGKGHAAIGHFPILTTVLRRLKADKTRPGPACVIARTIEGKGLDLMENQTGWHLGYLTPEDSEIAAQEILSKEI